MSAITLIDGSVQYASSGDYVPRIADRELKRKLDSAATVLIEGPKACGKTATASQVANSRVLFDIDDNARQACSIDPSLVLAGETPRLFDEWQLVPNLWNHVRRASDDRKRKGVFILTGSATPADNLTRHSGAGRISRLHLRTMSFFERGMSTGEVSLGDLLKAKEVSAAESKTTIPDLVERLCRGGWPGTLEESLSQAMAYVRNYIAEICRTDLQMGAGVRHDPDRVMRLMQSLARNISTDVTLKKLVGDLDGQDELMQYQTASSYLSSLARLFVTEELPPFAPYLRSRARLRRAAKRHFTDPSIAVASLRTNPDQLLKDFSFLGLLFESLVIHDLRVYASVHDAAISHYRDSTGLEVDAVIQAGMESWIPVEVKLGSEEATVDAAAKNLLKFVNKVDQDRMGAPANMLVVTSSGFAFQRKDGVTVVPIASLGP